MTKHVSFTQFEHDIRHEFRQNLNLAESTEDVKKFFVYAFHKLVEQVLGDKILLGYDDICLKDGKEDGFALSNTLKENDDFMEIWHHSDLRQILSRFAETANKHNKHLEKHPAKTERKIFQTPSHPGHSGGRPSGGRRS